MTTSQPTTNPPPDPGPDLTETMEFMGLAIRDFGGAAAVLLWALADELGVLPVLASGPATVDQLAAETGTDTRCVLDVLRGLVAAGYVADEGLGRFALLATHAAVLVDGSPFSCAGGAHEVVAMARMWPQIVESCRSGRGIDGASYPPQMAEGMARLGAPTYESALPSQWVPAVPGLVERLRVGASIADVGCGQGRALIALASVYPQVRATGFDVHQASLQAATTAAEDRSLGDRVEFRRLDAAGGIPGQFDLVLAFDVLHDAGDPAAFATALRKATTDNGVLLVLEPASADDPSDNVGPMAALLQLFSVGYCLQVATHAGPARLGTTGLPEPALTQLLATAGFSSVRRLPVEAGFNACYEARP
jgi:2-polyprenyl-3-methyl-5-hydroxy-6-metoxy-1,4-benzoquinol methylase